VILSVLDLSAVSAGASQAQALRETVAVAKAAERLGYHRFWVSEHHNIQGLGSASPEILIAALTQATSTIRLGSGGVMLVNYSPLKVAEVFMALEALAPGRIDLGVGRALGTDPRTASALRTAGSEAFPHYFALLNAWLLDASSTEPIPAGTPIHDIHANPAGPSHPDLFLLVSSPESAAFAGQAGVGMVFAEFIARTDAGPSIAAYRRAFESSVFRGAPWAGLATTALAAETREAAWRLDAPRRALALSTLDGGRRRFADADEALAWLDGRRDDARLAQIEARSLCGTGAEVRDGLARKAAEAGADEVFVLASGPTLQTRIRSLELIQAAA
jgi:luciferase family oxidoreductase group 1